MAPRIGERGCRGYCGSHVDVYMPTRARSQILARAWIAIANTNWYIRLHE